MGEYTHCYSTYVNHILNKSPSKTTYSFARSERFGERSPQRYKEQSSTPNKHGPSPQTKRCHGNNASSNNEDADINTKLDRFIRQMESERKAREKIKASSPPKEYRLDYLYEDVQQQKKKGNNRSPSQRKMNQTSTGQLRGQDKDQQRQLSTRISTQQKTDKDHPSSKITIAGYYPVGIEISPHGKYVTSTIRNVTGPKFGTSPPKNKMSYNKSVAPLGPGAYPIFSEFGRPHKRH